MKFEIPAFITSIAYDENNLIYCVTSSDSKLYVYEKTRVKEKAEDDQNKIEMKSTKLRCPEFNLANSFKAPCMQHRLFYMTV